MKVQLENEDMAELFSTDKIHIGAYLKAVEEIKKVQKLPWCATSLYVETVLNAISDFYKEQAGK